MSDAVLHASEPGSPRRQENAGTSRRRGRRRGVEIRPGSAKQARLESGLSLGQVARNDISRTAIYFVETGKAKPSIETLRLIAERTNKPLDFFLGQSGAVSVDPAAALVEIERLIATGDPAAAVEAADRLGGGPDVRPLGARAPGLPFPAPHQARRPLPPPPHALPPPR